MTTPIRIFCMLFTAFLPGLQHLQAQTFPQSSQVITFNSGSFRIVGELKLPEGKGPHPVILFVHGSGPTDRTSGSGYLPIMQVMLNSGFATFAWDKPGTGESIGQIDENRVIEQRSQIVLDAIEAIKKVQCIDKSKIGLWGISQAGYVMPVVLSRSQDITFMIAVSCPGEPGVDQGIYFITSQAVCAGLPQKDTKEVEELLSGIERARTYEEYVENKNKLISIPAFSFLTGVGVSKRIKAKSEWQPDDLTGPYYWNPMQLIENVKIPVLVLFGEKDTQADPKQGINAYKKALRKADNKDYRIEMIPGADHSLFISETGCLKEQQLKLNKKYSPVYLSLLNEWLNQLKDKW